VISADDANAIRSYGLVAMDCSWVYAEEVFARRPANGRRLPRLLAGNSVNYGRWERLSTAEALAAALVMVGEIEQAQTLLARFKWGPNFFVLNAELLDLEIGWKKSEQTTD
jgi:pre-rRNA-processing protein TSR3